MRIKFQSVLLLFVFLYPITPWYITIGPLNLVNILSIIFVFIWCFSSGIKIASLRNTSIWFWVYMCAYSLQALLDSTIMRSVAYIISQLMVCIIVFTEIRKRELIVKSLQMMVYAAGFLSVTGIVEEVTRTNIFHIISRLPESSVYREIRLGIYRIETSFSHPIVYCAYLCIIAGILVYLLNNTSERKQHNIYKAIYVLVLVNALLTMSRSTLLVLIIEQLIFGYMTGFVRFSKKLFLGLIIISIGMIVSSALNLSFVSRLKDVWYMVLALFDDKYSSMYSMAFGMNENGVGNRLELYSWVADAVKGHELFGMGTAAEFAYSVDAIDSTWHMAYTWTKTSIENEYLFNYYIHGIIGVVTFVLNIIGINYYAFKTNIKRRVSVNTEVEEKKTMTFSSVMLVLLLGYTFTLFSVRSSDVVRIINILVCLLFVYNFKLVRRE